MKRREFIAGVGASAAFGARGAWAQQGATIGLVGSGSATSNASLLEAFRKGLRTTGFDEGRNLHIEYRWAAGNYTDFRVLVEELVRLPIKVLVAFDNTALAREAQTATSVIPIVFSIGTDPVKFGLVSSLSRPTGNLTGVVSLTAGLGIKRLQVLTELLPDAKLLAMLVNPGNPAAETETRDIVDAAQSSKKALTILKAATVSEIDAAFSSAIEQRVEGVLIQSEPFLSSRRHQIAALGARHRLPVLDAYSDYVEAGGLISYGGSAAEARRIAGIYTGRLLKGDKTVDLPVQQSTKIELVINLKAAQAMNLTIPTSLLVRADTVVE